MLHENRKQFNKFIKSVFKKDWIIICFLEIISLLQILISIIQPIMLLRLVDGATERLKIHRIVEYASIYLCLSVLSCLFFFMYQLYSMKWKIKFESFLRDSLLRSLVNSENVISAGDIDTLLLKDISEIEEYVLFVLVQLPKTILWGISLFITITILNYQMTIIILALNLLVLFLQKIINDKIAVNSIKLRNKFTGFYGSISEISQNLNNARDFGGGNYIIHLCHRKFEGVSKYLLENTRLNSALNSVLDLLGGIIVIIVVAIGCLFLYFGVITVGILFSFVQYSGQVINFFNSLIQLPIKRANSTATVNKILEILYFEKGDNKENNSSKIEKLSTIRKIKISNLSFSYNQKNIFDEVNCEFNSNTINVIFGQSGCGKSTLFKILMRKEKQDSGKIYVNNISIDDYSREDILSFVGYLSQEDIVFGDSIKNNILIDRNYSEEKMIDVCKLCNIHKEIIELENGYDTILTPENLNISGGQIKRILLARLLMDDKKVLLLDEPTASLDFESVKAFMEVIQKLTVEKMIIIISHDPKIKEYPINCYYLDNRKIKICTVK